MIVIKELVIGKMNDETGGVTTEEFVELKLKRYYQYLVDDNSEHKKAIGANRSVVIPISYNEYKICFVE